MSSHIYIISASASNFFDSGEKHIIAMGLLLNSILKVIFNCWIAFFLCLTDYLKLLGKIQSKKTFSRVDGLEGMRGAIKSVAQSDLLKLFACERGALKI